MTATNAARPPRLVLGIETSCDETAAAIVEAGTRVRSSVVATQHELHEEYGGVVPEIASRAHLQRILPVIRRAIADAGVRLEDLDAVAVGHRPGLIGALLVGTSAAKGLALALDIPLVGVDHVHAHLVAGMLEREPPALPALGLVASGGHSSIYLVEDPIQPRLLGRTIDDAIGEAFDKVAAMLDLGHPGGPAVERLAASGDATAFALPVANLGRGSLDFSFSGLKTAVLYAARGQPGRTPPVLDDRRRADLAASFQAAAIKALQRNLRRAFDAHPEIRSLLVGGGVTANAAIRAMLQVECDGREIECRLPPLEWCIDNAAMIAALGDRRLAAGERDELELAPAATTRSDAGSA
ncbi:MAG: tRNA (adenosine(37)-N6)-threonylcarbamoyltransferase complex transferase subunit TsaD [Planctomycetaceae bacterium]|nr:tRNA (adenosine(37)-N6)-threonylcarbamoyltransferase complex transferase subunit TsaD [Planctomycetaceae bacterium]